MFRPTLGATWEKRAAAPSAASSSRSRPGSPPRPDGSCCTCRRIGPGKPDGRRCSRQFAAHHTPPPSDNPATRRNRTRTITGSKARGASSCPPAEYSDQTPAPHPLKQIGGGLEVVALGFVLYDLLAI